MSDIIPAPVDLRRLVTAWKGEKIARPGIYSNVPMGVYHDDLCIGPSVSHSTLWRLDSKSPRHAWREWYGNPNRKEPEEKPHLALGRAIHHLAGGEAQFAKHFCVRPAKWDSWRTKEAKEWRAEQMRLGMGVLTAEDIDTIQGVADSLNEHPTIQAGILKGLVEMTVVYQDPVTGLWVKARPDVIPLSSAMIPDLKTIAEATRKKCETAIGEYGYFGQMAIIDEALWQVAGFEATDHVLVFIEKSDPWCINLKPLPSCDIEWGRAYARRALDKFAACLESGDWHGYDDDEREGGMPAWKRAQFAYEAENGMLPKLRDRQPRDATLKAMAARASTTAKALAAPSLDDADEVIV
jgi:hypothetical protein